MVACAVAVGTGCVEVSLLYSIEHTGIYGAQLQSDGVAHTFGCHVAKRHYIAAQTVEHTEANTRHLVGNIVQRHAHLSVGIGPNGFRDAGIVIAFGKACQ